MFYYGSIFVTNADAPNLVGDFMRNRWAVVHGLQVDVNHYSDTETKMTLQFESPDDFPFDLIHALNTVSTVDFRWADEGQGIFGSWCDGERLDLSVDNDDEGYDPAGDTPWLDWVDSRI
jgi:hypothetical protein